MVEFIQKFLHRLISFLTLFVLAKRSHLSNPIFFLTSQTPEKRSHNGYTNLPDVVQPSHSPTDPAPHSSPGKDSVYDVSFPPVVVILL